MVSIRVPVTVALAAIAVGAGSTALSPEDARSRSQLTATAVRIENRPATVRIVIPFSGGRVSAAQVFLANPPRGLERGLGLVRVEVPGTTARMQNAFGRGVAVVLNPRAQSLVVRAAARPLRFKYLSYRIRRAPQRLAIDLWKSVPPKVGTPGRFGRRSCLTIGGVDSQPGRVVVSGTVGRLFEATFRVRIRRADGRVIKNRIVTIQPGQWQESIGYRIDSRERGTVEAVVESAKDGSLDCLAQRRVTLRQR